MKTCKRCGAEVSFWKRDLFGSLCQKCRVEETALRKTEESIRQEQVEAERERQLMQPYVEMNLRLAAQSIDHLVFVGLNGYALALHRDTGEIVWSNNEMKSGYVTMLVDGDRLIVSTNGYMYCLDPLSGKTLWHNPLTGYGSGTPTAIASVRGTVSQELLHQAAAHITARKQPAEHRLQQSDANGPP